MVGKSECVLAGCGMRRSDVSYSSSVGVIPVVVFIELFIANSTWVRYSDQSCCLILT
jgi:hypothetical protein